ncbi:Auxin-responsive protein saur32 [Turnera subulata]|uniref:Auxin-responsive protein saur32 n=1 Tax=Turnera subulata TaxID=218843 RepID=A0A9Q0J1Z7_9ROSI|nr:Auxin-responsive protein saur32 [Turnera subulata]
MGSGEKSLRNFHLHLPHLHHHHHHHNKKQATDVPKGCLAIKVGQGEEQQRFVVPVLYFNHPLFMHLLKEAEDEYGFDQKGTITIPCHVEEFRKEVNDDDDDDDDGDTKCCLQLYGTT